MAEIEPASDDGIAMVKGVAERRYWGRANIKIEAASLLAILTRLRAEQARADKAEGDRDHWHECFTQAAKAVVGKSGLTVHQRIDQLQQAEAFRAAAYAVAGPRPAACGEEPEWNVDILEVERRATQGGGNG